MGLTAKRFAVAGLIVFGFSLFVSVRCAAVRVDRAILAASARADLITLQNKLLADKRITFNATIIPRGDTGSEMVVLGALERPNRIRITIRRNNARILEIASNGTMTVAYAPKTGKYYRCVAKKSIVTPPDRAYLQFIDNQLGDAGTDGLFEFMAVISHATFVPSDSMVRSKGLRFAVSESFMKIQGVPVFSAVIQTTAAGHIGESDTAVTRLIYTKAPLAIKNCVISGGVSGERQIDMLSIGFNRFEADTTVGNALEFSYTPPRSAQRISAEDVAEAAAIGNTLPPGSIAPNFTVQRSDGKFVKLSDYAGRVVVLDCWATWCGPCQMALPHLDDIAKSYRRKGVVFLPVCVSDTRDDYTHWLGLHKNYTMEFFYDPAGENGFGFSSTKYRVDGYPTQFVIGKNNRIVGTFVGYDAQGDPYETALAKSINKALAARWRHGS